MRKIPRVTINCLQCGTDIEVRPLEVGHRKYCTVACRSKHSHSKLMQGKIQKARERRGAVRRQPESYKLIALGNAARAKVDNEDFPWLDEQVWRRNDGGYATNDGQPRRMHRRIMERHLARSLGNGEQIDHINGDRLDNRRANLRIVNNQENSFNQRPRKGSSKYRGVYWCTQKGKWKAVLILNRKALHVGFFDDEDWASVMRDQWALELYGQFAYLNFDYV